MDLIFLVLSGNVCGPFLFLSCPFSSVLLPFLTLRWLIYFQWYYSLLPELFTCARLITSLLHDSAFVLNKSPHNPFFSSVTSFSSLLALTILQRRTLCTYSFPAH
ncbi:unnamed protein product [Calicophoron daubneyi]|uniref:Uncharacterized protein n=1 Tax=Calicophoron daubneyi TaxID=300641 RepID=A0AAV2T8R4_CALDB